MIKKSLIAWQLNTEKGRWFRDEYVPLLERLGFRTQAKAGMQSAALLEAAVWGWAR